MDDSPPSQQQQRPDPTPSQVAGAVIYNAVTPRYDKNRLVEDPLEPWVRIERRVPPEEVTNRELATLWNREQKLMHPPRTGLWSVYVDGSLTPTGPMTALVEGWLATADVALFKHPHRTCAYAEIDACVARGKISPKDGDKARSHLMLAGFPKDFGLWALGMIARRTHANALQQFAMKIVFQHVAHDVPRDQIWFPFVLWRLKEASRRVHTIDADIFDNPYFTFRRHGS